MVVVNIVGVVEQAADERGFAVVDAARGAETQQALGKFSFKARFDGKTGTLKRLAVGYDNVCRSKHIRSSPRAF